MGATLLGSLLAGLLAASAAAEPPSAELKDFCRREKCLVAELESLETPPDLGSGRQIDEKDAARGFELKRGCSPEGAYPYIARSGGAPWKMKVRRVYGGSARPAMIRLLPIVLGGLSTWVSARGQCVASGQEYTASWPLSVPASGSRFIGVLLPSGRNWEARTSMNPLPQLSLGGSAIEIQPWMDFSDEWDRNLKKYFGAR
jgi:hypothetical protein